jgi:hypothetical protein
MSKLKLIHKGADTNEFYTASMHADGAWSGGTKIKDQVGRVNAASNSNPGFAMLNNWLFLVYKGTADNDLYLTWHDETRWRGNIKISTMLGSIDPKSNYSPNLALFKNALYMVYKGWNSNALFMAWFDGTTWHGNEPIFINGVNPQSNFNPGICAYKGRLHLVYKGWDRDVLRSASFDGQAWYGNVPISVDGVNPRSTYCPRICVFNNALYAVYKGWDSNALHAAWFDGTNWHGNQRISIGGVNPESNYNPAVSVFMNRLYLVYKGVDDNSLLSASFDGTTWSGNTLIRDQPGGIDPRSNENPNIYTVPSFPITRSDWMNDLSDSILIGDVNLPGSHDAAAINKYMKSPYACHNYSITDQLTHGVRVLDVRLKITKKAAAQYDFITCHGDVGSSTGLNEYQTFVSLMDECETFLEKHPGEAIVMSLKVDDWTSISTAQERGEALTELQAFLGRYPVERKGNMPALSSIRGRILLINRINNNIALGTPFPWVDNTPGFLIQRSANRDYDVFLQDKYQGLSLLSPEAEKTSLVESAFREYAAGRLVLNFASATKLGVLGVYIMAGLLDSFGKTPLNRRPVKFGWVMLDYPFNKYATNEYGYIDLVDIIVASNFQYKSYPKVFRVLESSDL